MTGNRIFSTCCAPTSRRAFLRTTAIAPATGLLGANFLTQMTYAAALTKDQRDKLTPDPIIQGMKQGNERFRSGKMSQQDFVAQKRATAAGQYPAAVILSCIDSRAPAEIILDARLETRG